MHSVVKTFIVDYVAARTRTFGGGKSIAFNPLADALKGTPLTFAAGVSVEEVVDLVFEAVKEGNEIIREADAEAGEVFEDQR